MKRSREDLIFLLRKPSENRTLFGKTFRNEVQNETQIFQLFFLYATLMQNENNLSSIDQELSNIGTFKEMIDRQDPGYR